ncbi:MAG: DUF5320 domain-containing protein [Oscillospiraceae bacterium]
MPGRDGTGPMGAGTMTGRGLGFCTGKNAAKYGAGLGLGLGLGLACRRGFRGGFRFAADQTSPTAQKDMLLEQKDLLQKRLEVIEKQLDNL